MELGRLGLPDTVGVTMEAVLGDRLKLTCFEQLLIRDSVPEIS